MQPIRNYQELLATGLFNAIVGAFSTPVTARILLSRIGFPPAQRPNFPQDGDPLTFWDTVCSRLEAGVLPNGFDALVQAASETIPGNETFARYRDGTLSSTGETRAPASAPPPPPLPKRRKPQSMGEDVIHLMVEGNIDENFLLDHAREIAYGLNLNSHREIDLALAFANIEGVLLNLTGWDMEEVPTLVHALEDSLRDYDDSVQISYSTSDFRDYLFQRLIVEGPDSQRFEINDIRASTLVKEIGQGIMSEYPGQPGGGTTRRRIVVDRVNDDGTAQRLEPNDTLHHANVNDGDTLSVNPESTAGAVNPIRRTEALIRASRQTAKFVEGNPGIQVSANAQHAPTQYVIRFNAPGFAPPPGPGQQPLRIDEHEVWIELSAGFPMVAPKVYWNHPLFHPNVAPQNGMVCLGILEDQYNPNLDFGLLIQMIIDIAGYRNYALHEGYYNKQARDWILTEEGQAAIKQIKGTNLDEAVLKHFSDSTLPLTFDVGADPDNRPPRRLQIAPLKNE